MVTTLRFPVIVGTKYIEVEGEYTHSSEKPSGNEYISDGISMSLFALSEGLDVFTLLDDVQTYPDFFLKDTQLFDAILASISTAIILLNVPFLPKKAKLVAVGLINIPFLWIRIKTYDLFGAIEYKDSSSNRKSSLFIFFIVKELLVIVLTIVEMAFEVIVKPFRCEHCHDLELPI